jgi:hypothetical protein
VEIPKYTQHKNVTTTEAKWNKDSWEVFMKMSCTRISEDGKEESFSFEVKSYDKDLSRAYATMFVSMAAYTNSHTEDELYGIAKSQTSDIKNTQA